MLAAAASSASSSAGGGGRAQHGEQSSGRSRELRCKESDLVVVKMGDC